MLQALKHHAANYWVWRIVDDDPHFSYVRDDIFQKSILRQGWSPCGVDIRKGADAYIKALKANDWPISDKDSGRNIGAVRRYKVLAKMLKIQAATETTDGDRIIVPRTGAVNPNTGDHFLILEAVKPYYTDAPANGHNDFYSCVGVRFLASYNYYDNNLTAAIAEKLNGKYPYGAAVNRIGETNAHLRDCIEQLIAGYVP